MSGPTRSRYATLWATISEFILPDNEKSFHQIYLESSWVQSTIYRQPQLRTTPWTCPHHSIGTRTVGSNCSFRSCPCQSPWFYPLCYQKCTNFPPWSMRHNYHGQQHLHHSRHPSSPNSSTFHIQLHQLQPESPDKHAASTTDQEVFNIGKLLLECLTKHANLNGKVSGTQINAKTCPSYREPLYTQTSASEKHIQNHLTITFRGQCGRQRLQRVKVEELK